MSDLKITSSTRLYGIIGNPIRHSLSPVMHSAAFESLGLDAVFLAFQVESSMLSQAISGFRAIEICGLSVTLPHKVEVMRYLDELDESAADVGAVNAIASKNGRLIGFNTDGVGALDALREVGVDPTGRRILILGAGGAGRALAFTLARTAQRTAILNRTESRAKSLAEDVKRVTGTAVVYGSLDSQGLNREIPNTDLLVNTTSVGMHPRSEGTPIEAKFLGPHMVVFDIVYSPLETRLLHEAKLAGARTVGGMMMLVHQGARAFELWTGRKAPVTVMTQAVEGVLRSSTSG